LFFAKDAPEDRFHRLQIEQRLVDVENDQRQSGHVIEPPIF
jgi:hypothetical protein